MDMARITKAEKLRRANIIRGILSRGGTRSECLELAATEWGLKPRSADFYIHEANQKIVQDFDIDRRDSQIAALAKAPAQQCLD